jgi:hypothetical protein
MDTSCNKQNWLPKHIKENEKLDAEISRARCPKCGSAIEYVFVPGGILETEGGPLITPYVGQVGCTECDEFYNAEQTYGADAKNWNNDGSSYVALKRKTWNNTKRIVKNQKFFTGITGKIVRIKKNGIVCVKDAATDGGKPMKVADCSTYVMVTYSTVLSFATATHYSEGFFVEPSENGCIKFNKVKLMFLSDSVDTNRGPFTEEDMFTSSMLGVYLPMTKKERSRHLLKLREHLAEHGTVISERFCKRACIEKECLKKELEGKPDEK